MSIANDVDILRDRLHAYIDQCKNIIANGYENCLREEVYFRLYFTQSYFYLFLNYIYLILGIHIDL